MLNKIVCRTKPLCHLSPFDVKPDALAALDLILGVSMCDSENPDQKPRILSVELEEMLICVDQGTHTNDSSLLPHHFHHILLFSSNTLSAS